MAKIDKDLQAQIDALRNEAMSEAELDGVAGGSTAQNWDIIIAMGKIDPGGVKEFMSAYQSQCAESHSNLPDMLAYGALSLLNKNSELISKMTGKGVVCCLSAEANGENVYAVNGKPGASHAEVMAVLNQFQGNDF